MSYNADVEASIESSLPSQYRVAADILLLYAGSWAPELQELEDDIRDLKQQRKWTTATGVWLDGWGELAQLPRPDGAQYEDDETYRRAIAARWASRRSWGDANGLILMACFFLGLEPADSGVVFSEFAPFAAFLDLPAILTAEDRAVVSECASTACRLGVRLIVSSLIPGSGMFGADVPLPSREFVANRRHSGLFSLEVSPRFMDYLRAGIYTAQSLEVG